MYLFFIPGLILYIYLVITPLSGYASRSSFNRDLGLFSVMIIFYIILAVNIFIYIGYVRFLS